MNTKTKILIALVLANVLAWSNAEAATKAEIDQVLTQLYLQDALAVHATCTAWNLLVAGQMPEGLAGAAIAGEGQRHFKIMRLDLTEEDAKFVVGVALEEAQRTYNEKEVSWSDLVTAAEWCTTK